MVIYGSKAKPAGLPSRRRAQRRCRPHEGRRVECTTATTGCHAGTSTAAPAVVVPIFYGHSMSVWLQWPRLIRRAAGPGFGESSGRPRCFPRAMLVCPARGGISSTDRPSGSLCPAAVFMRPIDFASRAGRAGDDDTFAVPFSRPGANPSPAGFSCAPSSTVTPVTVESRRGHPVIPTPSPSRRPTAASAPHRRPCPPRPVRVILQGVDDLDGGW